MDVTRRRAAVGIAALGALAAGGVAASRGIPGFGGDADPPDDDVGGGEDDEPPRPPFEVRTIDAPGSEAGTMTVPEAGTVTLVNFTRTACPTSQGYLSTVANARASVDDERVRFLSVIEYGRDPTDTDEEFADWWAEYGGGWPLGIDDDRRVFRYYEIDRTPSVVIVDGDGTVHLRDRERASASELVEAVEAALDAESGGG